MKIKTTYVCEICGLEHGTQEEAIECEQKHGKPNKVLLYPYKREDFLSTPRGYPKYAYLEMTNGAVCCYEYKTCVGNSIKDADFLMRDDK